MEGFKRTKIQNEKVHTINISELAIRRARGLSKSVTELDAFSFNREMVAVVLK
jgi:hypothetical protein